MIATDWHDKPLKDDTRVRALGGYKQKAAAIFLPGVSLDGIAGLDIRKGIEIGSLDINKPIYGVERDPDRARIIKHDMTTNVGLTDFRMHQGLLDFLELDQSVDFAFIDLMGTLEPEVLNWFSGVLAPRLTPDAHFSLTVAECPRGSLFMKKARIVYETHFPDVVEFARNHYGLEIERLLPVLLLRAAFHRYNFALVDRERYQNSAQGLYMLFYKFTDFEPVTDNTWPSLETIVELSKLITVERAVHEIPGTSYTDTKNWRNRPNENPTTPDQIAENSALFNSAWEIRTMLDAKHNLVLDYLITEQSWAVIVPATRTVLLPLYQTLDAVTTAFGLNRVAGD